MADVATHNTAEDCWLVIDETAYAVPSGFADVHKGGAAYVPYCGKDATAAFKSIKDGEGHPDKAYSVLPNLMVGKISG
jgi:cytochrome b involved in lipid metabolism